jgi:hypothetical protein
MALLALLAVIALGSSWFIVTKLNGESNILTAVNRDRNADTLNRAKQALIGYMAARAATAGENSPGAFPCPEAPADFNNATNEGTASASSCTPVVIGRFPWRTVGLDKLVDVASEPLWYAVASGWTGTSTVINSNCAYYNASGLACQSGRLSVDGTAVALSDVIAIIIAPGPAITVPNSANCSSRTQQRTTEAPPDWRDYLECQNATNPADNTFATSGPSGSFNDQLITITTKDVIPVLEAAIADRIKHEIVPLLKTVYTPADWGFAGTKPIYPFAAPFTDPSLTSGIWGGSSSTLTGTPPARISAGLIPVATSETSPSSRALCTAGSSAPLCQPDFVAWSSPSLSGSGMLNPNCTASTSTTLTCNYYRTCLIICLGSPPTYNYVITATISNVAMALRQKSIDTTKMTNVGTSPAPTVALTLAATSSGAASFTISGTTTASNGAGLGGVLGGTLCGISLGFGDICKTETITIPLTAVLVDHPLLDSSTSSSTGWFIRNKWHEVAYYAVAEGHSPTSLTGTPGCVTSTTCLSIANMTPGNNNRAILILAGRSINGSARPSPTLGDYLEFGNSTTSFESHSVSSAASLALPDTGSANAYSIASLTSIASGKSFVFKASNANTGASTLTTPATGALSLVNTDGSSLAASTIRANAALQATYDGTRFLLFKRPFNDRIVTVDSN